MREADFQRTVIDLAQTFGWRVAHFRPARTDSGWRTPVAADGAGFPDLVMMRDRIIFAELKTDVGKLTLPQKEWGEAITEARRRWEEDNVSMGDAGLLYDPFVYHVWRPADMPAIEALLRPTGRWRQRQPGEPR